MSPATWQASRVRYSTMPWHRQRTASYPPGPRFLYHLHILPNLSLKAVSLFPPSPSHPLVKIFVVCVWRVAFTVLSPFTLCVPCRLSLPLINNSNILCCLVHSLLWRATLDKSSNCEAVSDIFYFWPDLSICSPVSLGCSGISLHEKTSISFETQHFSAQPSTFHYYIL